MLERLFLKFEPLEHITGLIPRGLEKGGRQRRILLSEVFVFVCSLVKSGFVVIMCRKAVVYDILTGGIPKPSCLDEFIRLI
jgi:hypothetical protein